MSRCTRKISQLRQRLKYVEEQFLYLKILKLNILSVKYIEITLDTEKSEKRTETETAAYRQIIKYR